jgi:PAS domain S-box-containing protein/putative nucleotidyltransferase with HDIG domain
MEKIRILVVEDESVVAVDVERLLGSLGYSVAGRVSSGMTAIQAVKDKRPDLVLMDIKLEGEMDGIETAEKIHDVFDVPVVYLTAYADEKTLERAKATDPFGYITKPVEQGELQVAVEMALYKHKLERSLRESEERYRTLHTNIPVGVFRSYAEPGWYLISANPALAGMFGYDKPEDMTKVRVADFYLRPEEWRKSIDAIISTGAIDGFEVEFKRKDGTFFWGSLSARAIEGSEGKIVYFDGVLEDISERKRAEEALQESLEKLRRSLYGTVYTISRIVETRDPYTSGHQIRVAELARAISKNLGLSRDRTELIYIAAIVHDVGKVSVPSEVLNKPTKLTQFEWDMIKAHPEVGYEILKNVEFPWPVIDVVIQHHERLNGSGYPRGLKGDDIMLEARILSLADVVEAMSSHRPYRPELGVDKALEEISGNRGVLYDREAVNVCVNLFEEGGFHFSKPM